MHFSTIKQHGIGAYLIALFFMALYAGAVWYEHRLESDVASVATELATETLHTASQRSLSGFIASLAPQEARLSSFVTTPDAAIGIIEQIEALQGSTGARVTLNDVKVLDQDATTGEGTMTMTILAEGSWVQVSHVLALLDTFPKASWIDVVSLAGDGTEAGPATWTLRATMHMPLRN